MEHERHKLSPRLRRAWQSAKIFHVKKIFTDLTHVDVVACFVNLGVVQGEDGAINPEFGGNKVTVVAPSDDICRRTIFAVVPQADGVTNYKVRARRVNNAAVNRRKLVPEC
jgi:hypothetical protein